MDKKIYLDNAAGTRPYPEVIETIVDVLQNHWGNASAEYSLGLDARIIIDKVTEQVAKDINCNVDEIIWTSGACEANSLAIIGVLNMNQDMILCTTNLEHTSVVEAAKNAPSFVEYILLNDNYGHIKIDILEKTLKEIQRKYGTAFVSISFANSEIGVIQDIKAIAETIHKYGGLLHVDATQMYPWYQIDVQDLGIDLMSVSGQKLNCVKGIGFLYVRNRIDIEPMIYGSQQNGRRAGTLPTHLIAAFGTALSMTRNSNHSYIVKKYRDALLYQLLQVDSVHLNGPQIDGARLPNNISVTIDGVNAEMLVALCDLMGVIIARGAACKSHESKPSKTLLAIGLTAEQAASTIRISLDVFTSFDDVVNAAEIIVKLIKKIRNEN